MKKRSQLFIYILGAIVLLALVFTSIYFGDRNNKKDLNDSEIKTPGKIQLPGNDAKIYASLDDDVAGDSHLYPEISHDNVKSLLTSITTPDVYYWYFNSTILSSANEYSTNGILKFNNGNYMIESYMSGSDGKLLKSVIEEDGIVTIQTHNYSRTSTAEFNSESTNAFIEAGVPELALFLNDSGDDFKYSMHDSEYGKILYAEFISQKDGYSQEQRYYISLDFGIVIKAECYENGHLVYALNTITLYELENT